MSSSLHAGSAVFVLADVCARVQNVRICRKNGPESAVAVFKTRCVCVFVHSGYTVGCHNV